MAMVVAGFTGGEAEELRRAMGFKRSEEAHAAASRRSCARAWRATASPARRPSSIVLSITSFALYGFPESHAASFALIVYASAYLKAHYPGGVLHRAPQQPADGVLSSGHAREGRAAARRAVRADRRAGAQTGTAGCRPTARSGSGCASCRGCAKRWGGASRVLRVLGVLRGPGVLRGLRVPWGSGAQGARGARGQVLWHVGRGRRGCGGTRCQRLCAVRSAGPTTSG